MQTAVLSSRLNNLTGMICLRASFPTIEHKK
jgi:hypothetical protein